jgi:hypothetical protein
MRFYGIHCNKQREKGKRHALRRGMEIMENKMGFAIAFLNRFTYRQKKI